MVAMLMSHGGCAHESWWLCHDSYCGCVSDSLWLCPYMYIKQPEFSGCSPSSSSHWRLNFRQVLRLNLSSSSHWRLNFRIFAPLNWVFLFDQFPCSIHHGRMKHLDLKYFWLRDEVAIKKTLKTVHCPTNFLPADIQWRRLVMQHRHSLSQKM